MRFIPPNTLLGAIESVVLSRSVQRCTLQTSETLLGLLEGDTVGYPVDGDSDGDIEGEKLGDVEGDNDGDVVGDEKGDGVGALVVPTTSFVQFARLNPGHVSFPVLSHGEPCIV